MNTKKFIFLAFALFSTSLNTASGQDITANPNTDTVTVSGIIYYDSNGNGVADGKDKMAEGAKVSLMIYPAEDCKELKSTTTNLAGRYRFDDVGVGTYQLLITYPSGMTVLTRPFVVKPADGDLFLAFPVVNHISSARYTNLRVVNAGEKLLSINFDKKNAGVAKPPAASTSPFAP